MLLDTLGFNGPHIMFILTVTQIWKQTPYFITFLGGFFVNKYINEFLKNVFREPRTQGLRPLWGLLPEPLDLVKAQSRDWICQLRAMFSINNPEPNKLYVAKVHEYGMPSGHSQSAGYILGYLYFVKSKILNVSPITSSQSIIFIMISILCVITMFQRWESKAHSIPQIAVGVLLGIFVSWIVHTCIHYYVSLPKKMS